MNRSGWISFGMPGPSSSTSIVISCCAVSYPTRTAIEPPGIVWEPCRTNRSALPTRTRNRPGNLVGIERHEPGQLRLPRPSSVRRRTAPPDAGGREARTGGALACPWGRAGSVLLPRPSLWPCRSRATGSLSPRLLARKALVERQVELQHVHTRFAEQPQVAALGGSRNKAFTWSTETPRAFATRAAWRSALRGLMCGSNPDAEAVTASAGIGAFAVNTQRALSSSLKALISFTSSRLPLASLNWSSGSRRFVGNVVVEAVVHDAKS